MTQKVTIRKCYSVSYQGKIYFFVATSQVKLSIYKYQRFLSQIIHVRAFGIFQAFLYQSLSIYIFRIAFFSCECKRGGTIIFRFRFFSKVILRIKKN